MVAGVEYGRRPLIKKLPIKLQTPQAKNFGIKPNVPRGTTSMTTCTLCKKQKPIAEGLISDPCVCYDYRAQFAQQMRSMHPKTLEIWKIKRLEYLKKQAERYK